MLECSECSEVLSSIAIQHFLLLVLFHTLPYVWPGSALRQLDQLLPVGPRAYRAPALECRLVKYIQVQILVQVDWEPGPTEIVPKWARTS